MWFDEQEVSGVINANWDELSNLYKGLHQSFTISECDQLEEHCVYFMVQDVPVSDQFNGTDLLPVNYLTSFFIHTHKGRVKKRNGF